jgi:hypothetical protein
MVESELAEGMADGRSRHALNSQERWMRKRRSQETWKQRHREAYLAQKREIAHRPEYLAKRRELYAHRREAVMATSEEASFPRRGVRDRADQRGLDDLITLIILITLLVPL